MTIVLTGIMPGLIVVTADSAVTKDFEDGHREYEEGHKLFRFPGVGCVATWGEREGNRIGDFLRARIDPHHHSIEDLEALVWTYLTKEYQPHEHDLGAVGYHIAGFDRHSHPRFFEVLWGPKSRTRMTDAQWEYRRYDNTPSSRKGLIFSYGGRFDLIHTTVTTLIGLYNEEINTGGDLRYDYLNRPSGLVQFVDLVARFVGELTREVGPPFVSCLVSPSNEVQVLVNNSFSPVNVEEVKQKIDRLGIGKW